MTSRHGTYAMVNELLAAGLRHDDAYTTAFERLASFALDAEGTTELLDQIERSL
jgi:hypothetical protein